MNVYEKLLQARSELSKIESVDESAILRVCTDKGLFCYTNVKDDYTELVVVDVETEKQVIFTSPTVVEPIHPDKLFIDAPANMVARNRYMKKYMYMNLFALQEKEEAEKVPW